MQTAIKKTLTLGNKNHTLYFTHEVDGERIEIFLPVIPNAVGYSYNPNFAAQSIVGRLSPIYTFISGGDEMFNFSISLHNDLVENKLKEVVDNIKMLSYPRQIDGVVTYPKIYFSLGEFSGVVIVDTSIQWKKPIINGHYVLVDIGFSLRVVREITNPTVKLIDEGGDVSITTGKIYSSVVRDDHKNYIEYLRSRDYDTSVSDFVAQGTIDETYKSIYLDEALRTRDSQIDRLTYLLGIITNKDSKGNTQALSKWENVDYRLTGKNDTLQIKYGGKWLNVSKIKKDINKILDTAYEADESLLRTDIKKSKDEIYRVLELLEKSAEEVIGYGATT